MVKPLARWENHGAVGSIPAGSSPRMGASASGFRAVRCANQNTPGRAGVIKELLLLGWSMLVANLCCARSLEITHVIAIEILGSSQCFNLVFCLARWLLSSWSPLALRLLPAAT
jgi:hypothetical protein